MLHHSLLTAAHVLQFSNTGNKFIYKILVKYSLTIKTAE
ncbi:hypothetical protein THF5H11_11320 [Vibrio jasicida]|nr:hypothetical protein THF5H11_11320 [Vibrio jasicida]